MSRLDLVAPAWVRLGELRGRAAAFQAAADELRKEGIELTRWATDQLPGLGPVIPTLLERWRLHAERLEAIAKAAAEVASKAELDVAKRTEAYLAAERPVPPLHARAAAAIGSAVRGARSGWSRR